VTPIGVGLEAYTEGLRAGRCGVGRITRFDASAYRSQAAAELLGDVAFPQASEVGLVQTQRYGRTAAFGLAALAEALHTAGLGVDAVADSRTGLCFGGSTAGTPEAEVDLLELKEGEDYWSVAEPSVFLTTPVGSTADILVRLLGLRGPTSTISTACSSATNAIGLALRWLAGGQVDRVVAGGADALCRLTHAGFNSLGLVAPERPLPFDARREGMTIGEGAAFFVLERGDVARARGARSYGWLAGFGNVSEAHHLVQPRADGAGAAAAMSAALRDAGIAAGRVDYVNAHGTATKHNDLAEARALHSVFGARAARLPTSSTKSQVGHLLGASGAVELAAGLLGMNEGFLPPTAGWELADEEIELDTVPDAGRASSIGVFLSNSFAFGGNDSTLCLVHPDQEAP